MNNRDEVWLRMTTALNDAHQSEVTAGQRFAFGANWRRFLAVLNEERIAEAEQGLREFLRDGSLEGKTFLDIGSGSGLSSLAARRMGASVVSFDYDPQSVACTMELRQRYFDGDPNWQVMSGSVLDRTFLESLGTFDVVYSWGVLHHTGHMWQALENTTINTKPGGKLFIAIYNDCGDISRHWMKKKITYNRLPDFLKLPYAIAVWTPIEARYFLYNLAKFRPGDYFSQWTQYKKSRGMSRWHDMIDWIGGYPYEYSSAAQLTKFFEDKGYTVAAIKENDGYGCHQIVFDRVT